MIVTMKGEPITKAISTNFESEEASAEAIGIDVETLRSAIKGNPVVFSTALRICQALKVDAQKIMSLEPTLKALAIDGKNEVSETAILSHIVTGDVIKHILAHFDAHKRDEVSTILSLLLIEHGLELFEKNPVQGVFFIDEISVRAKRALRTLIKLENPPLYDAQKFYISTESEQPPESK